MGPAPSRWHKLRRLGCGGSDPLHDPSARHEAVQNPLLAGLVEVDGELVAVDGDDQPVAELLVEHPFSTGIAGAAAGRGGHQLGLDGLGTGGAAAVVAGPLLLGPLPAGRPVAAGEARARLLEPAPSV